MAIDKSKADVYGTFKKYTQMRDHPNASAHGGEWDVPCVLPGCTSERDALQLWPFRKPDKKIDKENEYAVTHFWCRKCGRSGDIIKFVTLMEKCSVAEACARLGIACTWKRKGTGTPVEHEVPTMTRVDPPSATWSKRAQAFVEECQHSLWQTEVGKAALAYLRGRGFTDEWIRQCGYGYNPGNPRHLPDDSPDRFDTLADWGLTVTYGNKAVWLARGIVIPWWINGTIWKVSIRRGKKDLQRDEAHLIKPRKYVAVKGGANGLYRADTILRGKPLILFEGEFNADILAQALAQAGITDVASVATGSTDKGRADNWLVEIAKASPILFSLDQDAGGKDALEKYWRKVFPQGLPWTASGGDMNEMYLSGKDVVKWFHLGLEVAYTDLDVQPKGVDTIPEVEEVEALRCAICGVSAEEDECFSYGEDGTPLCSIHLATGGVRLPIEMESYQVADDHVVLQPVEVDVVVEETSTADEDDGCVRVISTGKPFKRIVEQVAVRLAEQTHIALDLETTGVCAYSDKVVSIALGVPGVCETVLDMRPYYRLSDSEQAKWRQALACLFNREDMTWIGHNLKFDWTFLAVHFDVRLKRVYDTMLAEQVIRGLGLGGGSRNPETSVALLHTAARYELTVSKEERSWYVDLDKRTEAWSAPFPPEQLDYMYQDITVPYQIVALQEPLMQKRRLAAVVTLENEALPPIAAMEVHGMLVNVESWREAIQELHVQEAQLEQEITTLLSPALQASFDGSSSAPIKLTSAKHVLRSLASLGVTVTSTKAEALEPMVNKHPVIGKLLRWKELNKTCSTFGKSFLKHVAPNGRIHAHFGQIGAETGRMSCSNPNLQQIPKDGPWRQYLIAPKGHKIVKADLSNIELRILAELSSDKNMLRFFAEGKDLHAETAHTMFALPEDANPKMLMFAPGVSLRDVAKAVNFGVAYGQAAYGIAGKLHISEMQAEEALQKHRATYPQAIAHLDRVAREVLQRGYTRTLAGRFRHWSKEEMAANRNKVGREARNAPIQGSNADIIKRAMALLYDRLPSEAHIILAVHDEIVLECPDEQVDAVSTILTEQMVAACREYLHVVAIPAPDVVVENYWKKD